MRRKKTTGHACMYSCGDHFHPQTVIRHARQLADTFSYTISYQSQRMRANACKTVEERWNLLKQTSPAFLQVSLEIVLAQPRQIHYRRKKKRKKTHFSRFEWTSARCSLVSASCTQSRIEHARPDFFYIYVHAYKFFTKVQARKLILRSMFSEARCRGFHSPGQANCSKSFQMQLNSKIVFLPPIGRGKTL